ncbi:MAG: malate dehydrogenase [Candidatus Bipolaricaulia bacterium]
MDKKVTVVGAGYVGATTAQRIVERRLADVVITDILKGIPQGKALDMQESGPILGFDAEIVGTNGYEETADSDITVITAGLPRKPGMSREELIETNASIIKQVTEQIVRYSPDTILIMVTNPLDATTYVAKQVSGFPKHRVFGMAGILDTARFRTFIALELGVSVDNVQALVLGGHGDQMVPLPRYATVSGVPLPEQLDQETIDRLVDRTRRGGTEIVELLQTGSAFYAPSAAILEMVEAILLDRKKILPCAAYLEGEYGINDLYLGVPVKLGRTGVEQIIELDLTGEEQRQLERSVELVRDTVRQVKL